MIKLAPQREMLLRVAADVGMGRLEAHKSSVLLAERV